MSATINDLISQIKQVASEAALEVCWDYSEKSVAAEYEIPLLKVRRCIEATKTKITVTTTMGHITFTDRLKHSCVDLGCIGPDGKRIRFGIIHTLHPDDVNQWVPLCCPAAQKQAVQQWAFPEKSTKASRPPPEDFAFAPSK